MERLNRARTALRRAVGLMRAARVVALCVLLLGVAWPLSGQQTGTIAGTVTASASRAPLSSVQVYLIGTGTGGLSNASGAFRLLNVRPGTHQIRAERIGMAPRPAGDGPARARRWS